MTPEQISMVLAGQARIETELAEMRRAVVTLARVEERIASYTIEMNDNKAAQVTLERRVDEVERSIERYATITAIGAATIAIAAPYIIDFILK